jgi:hypothetical protein
MVVLDEFVHDPELGQSALPVGLDEEPALVAVHDRLQKNRTFEPGGEPLHGRAI